MILDTTGNEFVPMLWCTTSSIESIFSQCRAHDCVTALSFPSKITIMNTRKSMKSLSKNKMYLTHTEESQRMNSIETATGRLYKQRTDELAKWKEAIATNLKGSIPLFCINTLIISLNTNQTNGQKSY